MNLERIVYLWARFTAYWYLAIGCFVGAIWNRHHTMSFFKQATYGWATIAIIVMVACFSLKGLR